MKRIAHSPTPPRIEPSTISRGREVLNKKVQPVSYRVQIAEGPKVTHSERVQQARARRASPTTDHLITASGVGKRCAIVGNAQSIFDKGEGSIIDSFDVVVRINSEKIRDAKHQGIKTDLVFVHNGTDYKVRGYRKPWFSVININVQASDLMEFWTSQIREELNHETARPSTGFIAIAYMLRLGYDVSLFGFDWYATPTYYTKEYAWKNHFPEWEKEQVKTWLKDI